jgi:5S rRNA maturation endonuclease (ribonuclease M5)
MRERILELLATLPSERRVEDRGSSAWLRCPIHSGGNECTPSFKISLEGPYVGSHYCFGCGASGGWRNTVQVLGFPSAARFTVNGALAIETFSEKEIAALTGKRIEPEARRADYREPWPLFQEWRGIPGSVIDAVGGTMVFGGEGREPILRLPAMVRGYETGFIDCILNPKAGQRLKYLNSDATDGWSKDILFPFDYVKSLHPKVVALVEGPRDALQCISLGLPALATLGSSSWSDKCVRLILSLAPQVLILLLDPDEAGEKLRSRAYVDFADLLDVRSIRLPSKIQDGKRVKMLDPADLDTDKLRRVLKSVNIILEKCCDKLAVSWSPKL